MWQLLTISRPAEAAEARWDEIDFEAKEWKIPAARMKMNRDHTVPLGSRGLSLAQLSPAESPLMQVAQAQLKHLLPAHLMASFSPFFSQAGHTS
ncbi:hypothetical protein VEE50_10680 [Escherichia coli]|nr:hypothetical protein VEE50_10680 [Escherichia coli]